MYVIKMIWLDVRVHVKGVWKAKDKAREAFIYTLLTYSVLKIDRQSRFKHVKVVAHFTPVSAVPDPLATDCNYLRIIFIPKLNTKMEILSVFFFPFRVFRK